MADKKQRGGRQSDQGDRNVSGNPPQRPEKQGARKNIVEKKREKRGNENESKSDGRHGGNR
ncbi:MAG: hypothetical protein K0R82_112 [Flavipsychrobacter sp.]|nr:hypothetical protein [Flavipsychrobacter sp.]